MADGRERLREEGKKLGIDIDESPESYMTWLSHSLSSYKDTESGLRLACGLTVYLRANPNVHPPEEVREKVSLLHSRA